MTHLPRIAIAAPASGQGKTTVAVGIMAALSRSGHVVAPAKVGPDYVDPGYHALATGRPGRNLDPWLTSEDLIAPLLLHGALTPTPADVAVIEGVMGLFDGRIGGDGFASTAHLARLTRTPVVLVVDISSASRTIAATVHGLRSYDAVVGPDGQPRVEVVGVVLNKSGSPRHADEVRRSVEALGVPVLGVLPRDAGVSAPSRHLGLVPVAERDDAVAALDRLAEQTAQFVDLRALLELAGQAPDIDAQPWVPAVALRAGSGAAVDRAGTDPADRPVVAVAGGRAFTFRYAETEELLAAAGCRPVPFDPAVDTQLPAGTAGLYLGGGFPEVHAVALARNASLLREVREAVTDGVPTVAECAGLLYLAQSVDGHDLVGAVPTRAAMHPRLTLRYRTSSTTVDTVLGPAGTTVRGHEFHRTRTDPIAGVVPAWLTDGDGDGWALDPAGTGTPTLHASYLHTHWAGAPDLAASFAAAVRAGTPRRSAPASIPGTTRPGTARVTPPLDTEPLDTEPLDTDPINHDPLDHDPLNHHGDAELGPGLVDLAVNVRQPQPPRWLAAQIDATTPGLGAYPSTARARTALARRHEVPEEMVLPTAGAAEAFTLVARALTPRRPLIVHPQFTEPDSALRRAGHDPAHHVLDAATGFVLDPTALPTDADLVIVGNPTNPTGVLHPREALLALRRPGRVLLVDEAFLDAVPSSPESLIGPDMPGVLVIRSLTKTWALAGLRAGYVVGDPALIAELATQQPHWSVSSPAATVMEATATPAALAEADGLAREGVGWREHLVRGLTRLGLTPVAGAAPFVLVAVGPGVHPALRARGYAVRRGDTFPGLDHHWVRIAVRDPLTTDGLLRELAALLPTERTP
ncbi:MULTISPECIES: cobyrinate a,c-diamide synthase [unclassified Janibacter]|uniref:cobyrinate a,c-diamide synthase n=1 Tax=unclassified Janibacter TaxID=2649294 RepID=UPI003D03F4D4